MRKLLLLGLALAFVLGSQVLIARQFADVTVTTHTIAGNPADRYAAVAPSRGTVIVAHGFAGSRVLMQYWGYALARQGFDTYLFDHPGHGENRRPLPLHGGLPTGPLGENLKGIVQELLSSGQAKPGRIALVGHSMGGATVVATALDEPLITATVTLSSAYRNPLPADRPANLLSLVAERDPASIRQAAAAVAPQGERRKTVQVADRNHLTILYDAQVVATTADWIHTAFGTQSPAPVAPLAPWPFIGLALTSGLGAVLAAARLLAGRPATGGGSRSPGLSLTTGLVALGTASLSAVLAAVYLRLPLVGVAVVDYLLPYFAVMALVLLVLRWLWPREFAYPLTQGGEDMPVAVLRGLGILLAYLGAVVPVIHRSLAHHMPAAPRLMPLAVIALVLWLYFVQEEGLKRSVSLRWGSWAGLLLGVTGKLIIMGTWLGASALPNPPGFLTLTLPVTAIVLVVLELLSFALGVWRYSSATAATLSAGVLAWAIAASFPLI